MKRSSGESRSVRTHSMLNDVIRGVAFVIAATVILGVTGGTLLEASLVTHVIALPVLVIPGVFVGVVYHLMAKRFRAQL